MIDSEAAIERVRRALPRDPRIDFEHQAVSRTFANGELLLSGDVGNSAIKRLAVERARRGTVSDGGDRRIAGTTRSAMPCGRF